MIRKLSKPIILLLVIFTNCNSNDSENKFINISTESLIMEFTNDSVTALRKYKGKLLQITGRIVEKEFPKDNIPARDASQIIFGVVDERGNPLFSGNTIIVCNFDEVVVHDLNEGETVTVRCYFKNYRNSYGDVNEIILNKGRILAVGGHEITEDTAGSNRRTGR